MLTAMILFNYLKNQVCSLFVYAITKRKKSVIFNKVENILKIKNAEIFKTRNAPPKSICIWIDGKCFNVKPFKTPKSSTKINVDALNDLCNKNDVALVTKENGLITTSLKLPSFYYKKLRFGMMDNVKIIMEETNTHISIPRTDNDKLRVLGDHKQQVRIAAQEILSLIVNIRNMSRPMQFLSIPLCNEEIIKNFMVFRQNILQEKDLNGVDETLFISPLKLHLTVNVMVLLDESEKQEAIRGLQDYERLILKPLLDKTGPLKVEVSGIECMNKNYEKTHVLFAKAKLQKETESVNLQSIVNGLSHYFYERGLLKQHSDDVTIHMTLMNTKYREDAKNSKLSKKLRFAKKAPFDASKIMEKYKCFKFGDCDFKEIHISLMSSVDKSGFYAPLAVVEL